VKVVSPACWELIHIEMILLLMYSFVVLDCVITVNPENATCMDGGNTTFTCTSNFDSVIWRKQCPQDDDYERINTDCNCTSGDTIDNSYVARLSINECSSMDHECQYICGDGQTNSSSATLSITDDTST
jgi:hypothetical protein